MTSGITPSACITTFAISSNSAGRGLDVLTLLDALGVALGVRVHSASARLARFVARASDRIKRREGPGAAVVPGPLAAALEAVAEVNPERLGACATRALQSLLISCSPSAAAWSGHAGPALDFAPATQCCRRGRPLQTTLDGGSASSGVRARVIALCFVLVAELRRRSGWCRRVTRRVTRLAAPIRAMG
jgi:hypothetical protein